MPATLFVSLSGLTDAHPTAAAELVAELDAREVPLSLLLRPAGLIGGDLVGFRRLCDQLVAFHALDVSGHGVAAALLAARMAAEKASIDSRGGTRRIGRLLLREGRGPIPPR